MREAEQPVLDPDPHPEADPVERERGIEDRWGPWKKAVAVVLVTHLACIALAWAGSYYFGSFDGPPQESFTQLWERWDTQHYVAIAEHGYSSPDTYEFAQAFFPLYPMAIRGLSALGLNGVMAGMLISAVASVVALAFLYKLAEEDLYPGAGTRAMLYLALFPTAVFLTAAYSESLFLAGAIPAFYFARRHRWHLVGVPAAVAMGTRVAGIFVLIGLAVEFFRQRDFDRDRIKKVAGSAALALAPLVAYMAYLWAANDDPFYFVTAQEAGWQRELTHPWDALKATWNTYYGDYPSVWLLAWRVEIAAAAAGIAATAWAVARKEYGYAAYMGTLMIPLLLSSWYLSIPRMLLSMFPIPLLIASVTRAEQRHGLVLGTSALFAGLGVLVFTRGLWFF